MLRRTLAIIALTVFLGGLTPPARQVQAQQQTKGITFRVKLDPKQVGAKPESGRVLVGIAKAKQRPNFTNYRPPVLPILGADADAFAADTVVTLDGNSTTFPFVRLSDFPAAEYSVQAVFASNRDINLPNAPGNRYCDPVTVKLDAAAGTTVDLTLNKAYVERAAKESKTHKFLKLPSKLLSDFHGRPMEFRVGVVLPTNFDNEPEKKYGLFVDIGGFGTRYTSAGRMTRTRVRADCPRRRGTVRRSLSGGFREQRALRCSADARSDPVYREDLPLLRNTEVATTTGGSTGGWVSLALQVFYPDFFNGCFSQCPDSVTFERFELADIYNEPNVYVNRFGNDRPGTRTIDGDIISSVRHECQLECVLGRGGKWELSGRDWASWNATYGPKGKDGLPAPLWDGKTGAIDKSVVEHWKKYDLKMVLEKNWKELGPKLTGKIHIWVGDSDDYFLNAAVRRFKDSTDQLRNPKFDGTILIEARAGHASGGWSRKEMLDAMAARMK